MHVHVIYYLVYEMTCNCVKSLYTVACHLKCEHLQFQQNNFPSHFPYTLHLQACTRDSILCVRTYNVLSLHAPTMTCNCVKNKIQFCSLHSCMSLELNSNVQLTSLPFSTHSIAVTYLKLHYNSL